MVLPGGQQQFVSASPQQGTSTCAWPAGARPSPPAGQSAPPTTSATNWQASQSQALADGQPQQQQGATVMPQLVRQQGATTTQYVATAGGRVVVPQWQQQQGAAGVTVATTIAGTPGTVVRAAVPGGVPASSMQILQTQASHINHIRQQFPNLTVPECQQLLSVLPIHLREMQNRDNAGRSEYLSTLTVKEQQVVTYFHMRRHHSLMQRQQAVLQQQKLQQQQAAAAAGQPQLQQIVQQKAGLQQVTVAPAGWQPAGQTQVVTAGGVPAGQQQQPGQQPFGVRPVNPIYTANGQVSPHLVNQVSPGASPLHQDSSLVTHSTLAGGLHHNLVNQKTKTALANLLSNRLSGTGPQQMELPVGPGEQVVIYRRTLANITGGGNAPGATLVRPAGAPHHITPPGYPRPAGPHSPGQVPPNMVGGAAQHYPRPSLFGHDTNTMLPRELCLVGCVFYIADYHAELLPHVIDTWRRVIQQHGGEVVGVYDSVRVTHILCKNQQSPMYLQGVKEGKRCITIFWLNDILLRGKMAPPWQAIHLPTPFGNDNKPCKDLVISITGFEKEEKAIIKLMIQLVGAKHTGNFSRSNHILISKKFEGSSSAKVAKAKEYRTPIVNGIWLSEVLQGQNVPPLVCHGSKYQHQLDDPLRIDPSLASHLFNAWKQPISVSKESVEKAKAIRESALRKRKSEVIDGV